MTCRACSRTALQCRYEWEVDRRLAPVIEYRRMGRRTQVAKGGVCKTSIQRFDSARRLVPHPTRRFLRRISSVVVSAWLVLMSGQPAGCVATIRPGVLQTVDADSRQVSVVHGAEVVRYQLPATAVVIRQKRLCELKDMPAGAKVQVRYRVSTSQPFHAYDLVEAESWAWLQRMRRDIISGQLVAVDERTVVLEDARDHGRLPYRVTDKTSIEIQNRPATQALLKAGMKVWLAPRLLPNGAAMATAIADTEAAARRLKERRQPTVTGSIVEWDPPSRCVKLHTRAGDVRVLRLAPDCVIRQEGRDLSADRLRKGLVVTAHLRPSETSEALAHRITVKGRGATNGKKP